MSKEIAGTRDYTASEDINDVRQLIALVKERPAVKKAGDRATLISYAELTMIEKRLVHALGQLGVRQAADMLAEKTAEALAFPRPMGATPAYTFQPYDVLQVKRKGEWLDYSTLRTDAEGAIAKQAVEQGYLQGEELPFRIVRNSWPVKPGTVVYSQGE